MNGPIRLLSWNRQSTPSEARSNLLVSGRFDSPVALKRCISSASRCRPKMNTWGYPIVEEVDHEDVS
ncbi:hypothetical protein ABIC10_008931 [Bradyrhizobium sp. S3.2.12]